MISAGKQEKLLKENSEIIKALARLESLQINKSTNKPSNSIGFVEKGVEVFIDLAGLIDATKEKARVEAEIKALDGYVAGLKAKLANPEFTQKAPPAVVEKERAKLKDAEEKIKTLSLQL